MSDYRFLQEGKNIFVNFSKFDMYAELPDNPGKRAKLAFAIREGNPRLTVFLNNGSMNIMDNSMYAPFTPEAFGIFLDLFERSIKGQPGDRFKVDCLGNARDSSGGIDKTQKEVISSIFFGKDKEGINWISVVAEGKPRIVFQFKNSEWHSFFKGDGSKISEQELSDIEALYKVNTLRNLLNQSSFNYNRIYAQEGKMTGKRDSKPPKKDTGTSGNFSEDDLPF